MLSLDVGDARGVLLIDVRDVVVDGLPLGCDELEAGPKFAGLALVHLRGAACGGGGGVMRLLFAARSGL